MRSHCMQSTRISSKVYVLIFKANSFQLTWPVSVSNLYNRMAGLFDPPSIFLGVIDGAIMIQLTGFPIFPFYFHLNNKRRRNGWERSEARMDMQGKEDWTENYNSEFSFRIKQLTNEKYIFKMLTNWANTPRRKGGERKARNERQKAIVVEDKRARNEIENGNALPMSLYTILKESECRWPKNCPWIIDEYFRINLRYLKLFFSEYVVWPFGMIPICLSSLPGGMCPTIYT